LTVEDEPISLAESAIVAQLRALVKRSADDYLPQLAEALVELSRAQALHHRYDQAMHAADEAVDLYEELAEGLPGAYRDSYGRATFNLGLRLRDLGRVDDAHQLYQEGIEIRRREHRHDPYERAHVLGATLSDYSEQLLRDDRPAEALAAAQEAVALYRTAREEEPDAFTAELAGTLLRLARALQAVGQPDDAVDALKRSVSLFKRAAAADDAHEPGLATARQELAALQDRAAAPS
jgi:tetratricopeptide (TPR) repeat protein